MALTHKLPPVHLLETDSDLAKMVRQIRREPLIALDTESNSLYAYREQVCLIQLSTPKADYLIDPLRVANLKPLGEVLANPAVEVVMHAAEYDIACLKRDFGFQFTRIFDTMMGAKVLGIQHFGLARLLEQHFGVAHDKRFQRADWGKRPLTPAQQRYAQTDTHFLPALRDLIREQLLAQGALEEAEEIFEELTQTRPTLTEFDPNGFWSLHGAQHFSARQMALLRELYLWRETVAEALDIPRFKIMGDDVLVQIVLGNPRSLGDLRKKNLISEHVAQEYGLALLNALAQGRKAPLPTRPHYQGNNREVVRRNDSLKEWRKRRALERGVDSDIIIRREVLWQIARHAPRTLDELAKITDLGPWRRNRYGSEILDVLWNPNSEFRPR